MRQAENNRQPIPRVIQEAPELEPGLALYYNAFTSVTSCRAAGGMGIGPIMWTAKRDYCDEYGIFGWQREYLYDLVSRMDGAYLKYISNKNEEKAKLNKQRRSV